MGRDSIVSDAERNREKDSEQVEQSDSAENESESSNERVRVTQRLPADLAEDIDEIQNQYNLPTRNATINFILTQGIDQLRS